MTNQFTPLADAQDPEDIHQNETPGWRLAAGPDDEADSDEDDDLDDEDDDEDFDDEDEDEDADDADESEEPA